MIVDYYLPNLADGDILWLKNSSSQVLIDVSPELAEWIHDVCLREEYRRNQLDSELPVEVQIPHFPISDWDDPATGRALLAIWSLEAAETISVESRGFLERLSRIIVTAAACRLGVTEPVGITL